MTLTLQPAPVARPLGRLPGLTEFIATVEAAYRDHGLTPARNCWFSCDHTRVCPLTALAVAAGIVTVVELRYCLTRAAGIWAVDEMKTKIGVWSTALFGASWQAGLIDPIDGRRYSPGQWDIAEYTAGYKVGKELVRRLWPDEPCQTI